MMLCCGRPSRDEGRHMVQVATEVTQAQIEQRYRIDAGEIGRGNYATVKRAVRRADGLMVAMKFIDKSHEDLNAEVMATEARIMLELDHPNCIKCYEVLETPTHVVLALEMASFGDLFSLYERPDRYTEADAAKNVKEMMDGLAYLHSRNIAHRDLKLENVLVGADHVLKICDFGFAKALSGGSILKTACGTPEYVAPEVISSQGAAYSPKCDVWSLGVITYIMLCGRRPFWHDNQARLLRMILEPAVKPSFTGKRWKLISEDAKDFVQKCLEKDPEDRPSAAAALQHPWVAGLAPTSSDVDITIVSQDFRRAELRRRFRKAVNAVRAANRMAAWE